MNEREVKGGNWFAAHGGAGPVIWLATGLYVGFLPIVPGTFGSVWGVLLAIAIQQAGGIWLQAAILIGLWWASVPVCTMAARRLDRGKDPNAIVLDEILSLPVTYFGLDATQPALLIGGFLLFRVFDIVKPPPVRQAERLPRGLGIMADDVVAALYARAVLALLIAWQVL